MNIAAKFLKMDLREISFLSNDQYVLLKGNTYEQNLSYPSEVYWPMSELNNVLNNLRKNTSNSRIAEIKFEQFASVEDEDFYIWTNTGEQNCAIELTYNSDSKILKQIRA